MNDIMLLVNFSCYLFLLNSSWLWNLKNKKRRDIDILTHFKTWMATLDIRYPPWWGSFLSQENKSIRTYIHCKRKYLSLLIPNDSNQSLHCLLDLSPSIKIYCQNYNSLIDQFISHIINQLPELLLIDWFPQYYQSIDWFDSKWLYRLCFVINSYCLSNNQILDSVLTS